MRSGVYAHMSAPVCVCMRSHVCMLTRSKATHGNALQARLAEWEWGQHCQCQGVSTCAGSVFADKHQVQPWGSAHACCRPTGNGVQRGRKRRGQPQAPGFVEHIHTGRAARAAHAPWDTAWPPLL